MPKKLTALVIGAGNIGAMYDSPISNNFQTYSHAISANKSVELLGFIDTVIVKAKRASNVWGGRAFKTLHDAMIEKPNIVCVAVPDDQHFQTLMEIVAYQPDLVIAEKPLALYIDQATQLVKVYSQLKIPLMINYSRRYLPIFQKLQKEISEKRFGVFQTGVGYYGKGLLHNGSHLVDLIRMLIGEIRIQHKFSELLDWSKLDASVSLILNTLEDKKIPLLAVDAKNFSIFELALLFTGGRVRILQGGLYIEESVVKNDQLIEGFRGLKVESIYSTNASNCMKYVIENAVDCLKNNKKIIVSGKEALITLQTCLTVEPL